MNTNDSREIKQPMMTFYNVFDRDHGLDEPVGSQLEMSCNANEFMNAMSLALIKDPDLLEMIEACVDTAKFTIQDDPELTKKIKENSIRINRRI